ncbi:MAG: hypothetical protein HC774_06000 [Sphingomonadales bacterium]|nr:hypothetical protein [Sphingomonadales bacterium]
MAETWASAHFVQYQRGALERPRLGRRERDPLDQPGRQMPRVQAHWLTQREKRPATTRTIAHQFLHIGRSIDRLEVPRPCLQIAPRATNGTLRARGLRRRQITHLLALHLAAEPFAQFVCSPLDDRVMRNALDGAIGATQLDLDLRRLPKQSFQLFLELLHPRRIQRIPRTFFGIVSNGKSLT